MKKREMELEIARLKGQIEVLERELAAQRYTVQPYVAPVWPKVWCSDTVPLTVGPGNTLPSANIGTAWNDGAVPFISGLWPVKE